MPLLSFVSVDNNGYCYVPIHSRGAFVQAVSLAESILGGFGAQQYAPNQNGQKFWDSSLLMMNRGLGNLIYFIS